MQSPSSQLNAYILDYKASRSLQNSPYASPVSTRSRTPQSQYTSKSWLQEVLSMPPKKDLAQPTYSTSHTPKNADAISSWLDELDRKIEKRFPKVNKVVDMIDESQSTAELGANHTDSDSDKTLELVMADPETGLLDVCASYDSHPNMSSMIEKDSTSCCCDCRTLQAPAWVDEVIDGNLCDSCIQEELQQSNFRPKAMEKSVDLPEGYNLLKTKKQRKPKGKSGSGKEEEKVTDTTKAGILSPETATVMGLLSRAIEQLQEVKVAVEDNTVSAVTISDVSTISQAVSDLPSDV